MINQTKKERVSEERPVAFIIGVKGRAESIDILPPDVEPGSQRVAAETLQIFGTGGERLVNIETAAAPAGTLPHIPGEGNHDGREVELLGEPGRGNADDTLVPVILGEDDRAVRGSPTQALLRVAPDFILNSLPLAIEIGKLQNQIGGLLRVFREHQLFRLRRLPEAACRIEAGVESVLIMRSVIGKGCRSRISKSV